LKAPVHLIEGDKSLRAIAVCGSVLLAVEGALVCAYLLLPGVAIFDLDGAATLWTWLSSLQLAAVACAFLFARHSERHPRHAYPGSARARLPLAWCWLPLALVFFCLSADEVLSLHEDLASVVMHLLPRSGPMHDILPWQVVLAPALFVVFTGLLAVADSRLAYSPVLMRLARAAPAFLVVAFVVDGGLKAYMPTRPAVVVKESAELIAETCLLLAFAGYAAATMSRDVEIRGARLRVITAVAGSLVILTVVTAVVAHGARPAYFYQRLAENLEHDGRHDRAVTAYEHAVASTPGDADLWHALALAALRARQYPRAGEAFRRETELRPGDAVAFSFVGIVAFLQGDLDGAQRAYERALAIDPRFAKAHRNLGWVYERRSDDARAEQEYRAALARDERMADVHRSLGDLLARTARLEEARVHWRRSLELDPDQQDSTLLAERIAER
jgi:tetratricopeptide (TPR) repeat protein